MLRNLGFQTNRTNFTPPIFCLFIHCIINRTRNNIFLNSDRFGRVWRMTPKYFHPLPPDFSKRGGGGVLAPDDRSFDQAMAALKSNAAMMDGPGHPPGHASGHSFPCHGPRKRFVTQCG